MRNMIQYSSIWMPECCGGAIVGRFQGRGFAGGGAGSSSCLLALASSVTGFGHCFKPPSTLCADASCPHRRCILITKTYHILVQRRHLRCWVRLPRRLFLLPVRQRSCFSPGRVSSSASAPEACAVVAGDAQIDGGDARRPSRRHSLSDVFEDGRCSWSPSGCDQEHGSGLDHLSTMDSTSLLPASQQLLGSWLLASLEGEEMKTASQTGDSDSLLLVDNFCEEIGFPTPASRWWDRNSSDSHFRWLVPQSLPKKPVQGKLSYAEMAARPGDGWATSWGSSGRATAVPASTSPKIWRQQRWQGGAAQGQHHSFSKFHQGANPGPPIMETSRGLPSKLDRYNHPQRRCRQTKNNRGRYQRSK